MTYLICQDWCNTTHNHAGIKYFCNKISELYPEKYSCIVFPDYNNITGINHSRVFRKVLYLQGKIRHRICSRKILKVLLESLNLGDRVILMEYMDLTYPMLSFARNLKSHKPDVKLYAMIHLTPMKLKKSFQPETLKMWASAVDKILTLGHSLSSYLIEQGVTQTKIVTLFHPVDEYYLTQTLVRRHNGNIRVIAMGNQMRDMDMLTAVIKANPDVQFVVLQGLDDLSASLGKCPNVKLLPFIEEIELRRYMSESDISLNTMYDTVGSNVIVTSLGMGLAMLCSDVGSIRDYCNDGNTIFCSSIDGFTAALNRLKTDGCLLDRMRQSSVDKASELTLEKFVKQIDSI